MKYLSLIFISFGCVATFAANSGFVNHNSPQLIMNVMSVFLSPFADKSAGASASSTPIYLIVQNSTYLLICIGATFCVLAGILELIRTFKFGRSSKSACVVALSVCFLILNVKLLFWNL